MWLDMRLMDFEMAYDLVMISVLRYLYSCIDMMYCHHKIDRLVPKAEYEPNYYWRGRGVQVQGNTAASKPQWRIV